MLSGSEPPCRGAGEAPGDAAWGGCGAVRKGSSNQKRLPLPGVLCTPIVPPISSTSLREIVSPRPAPPNLRLYEESPWVNASKIESMRSLGMPIPVSLTENAPERRAVPGGRLFERHRYFALLREFHGVGQQVQQHLADAHRIPAHARARRRPKLQFQGDALALRVFVEEMRHLGDFSAQIQLALFDPHSAGLNARQVKGVVHQRQKQLRTGVDCEQLLALLGREIPFQQQLGIADDAVQGGANLMAHVGQEFRFHLERTERVIPRMPGLLGTALQRLGRLAPLFFYADQSGDNVQQVQIFAGGLDIPAVYDAQRGNRLPLETAPGVRYRSPVRKSARTDRYRRKMFAGGGGLRSALGAPRR